MELPHYKLCEKYQFGNRYLVTKFDFTYCVIKKIAVPIGRWNGKLCFFAFAQFCSALLTVFI
jgi:hypothetical protein